MAELLTPVTVIVSVSIYLFACGLGGAYCSSQRDRLGLEGFVLGLLFGPAGLIAAACLPEGGRPRPPGAEEPDEDDECGHQAVRHLTGRRLLGEVEE